MKILRILFFLALPIALTATAAAADTRATPQTRYEWAVKQIQKSGLAKKGRIPRSFFKRLDWVGKTAVINVTCGQEGSKTCLSALKQGLRDNALVVRDHALRVVLKSESLKLGTKRKIAESVVNDDRNYRRGRAFWIVQNAQSFLDASAASSLSASRGQTPGAAEH